MKRRVWILLGAAASASACSTIFGDFTVAGGTSSGTTATSTTSTGGPATTSTTTGTGGAVNDCDAGTMCSGSCVDMSSDAHNCGRCGHDCLHGTCSTGLCQPWPVALNANVFVMGPSGFGVNQMDSDGKYLVWIDMAGNLNQIEIAGGGILQASIKAQVDLDQPTLQNGTVAFVSTDSSGIYTVPEGQATATLQATIPSTYTVSQLALNPSATVALLVGTTASSPNQGNLLRCVLGGTTCSPLGPMPAPYRGLCVNKTYAFFAGSSPASIVSYDFTAIAQHTVDTANVYDIAIDDSNVYWIGGMAGAATIYSLPQSFTGSETPFQITSSMMEVGGLATDGANVYFGEVNMEGNASLYYAPVGGGKPTILYTSSYDSSSTGEGYVIAAAGAVYWADVDLAENPQRSNIMGIAAP